MKLGFAQDFSLSVHRKKKVILFIHSSASLRHLTLSAARTTIRTFVPNYVHYCGAETSTLVKCTTKIIIDAHKFIQDS